MISTENCYIQENGDLRIEYYYGKTVIIPHSVMKRCLEEQKLRERRDKKSKYPAYRAEDKW